jgi:hypothetical protein
MDKDARLELRLPVSTKNAMQQHAAKTDVTISDLVRRLWRAEQRRIAKRKREG